MIKEFTTNVVSRSKNCNALCITIKNTSNTSSYVTLKIYDCSNGYKNTVFSKRFYLSPNSSKMILFPLVSRHYDDFTDISRYVVSYFTESNCIQVSCKQVYNAGLDD